MYHTAITLVTYDTHMNFFKFVAVCIRATETIKETISGTKSVICHDCGEEVTRGIIRYHRLEWCKESPLNFSDSE